MIVWLAKFSQLSSDSASRIRHVIPDFRDSVTIRPAICFKRVVYEDCLPNYEIIGCAPVTYVNKGQACRNNASMWLQRYVCGFTCSRGAFVANSSRQLGPPLELKGVVVWLKP